MILVPNSDYNINDSKKISELRKLTTVTKHKENTWIPIAQYNSRTETYTNAAINLQAITTYLTNNMYAYVAYEFDDEWLKLKQTGHWEKYDEFRSYIRNSYIADSLVSYTFTYTVDYFQWQIVPYSQIPGYHKQPSLEELYDSRIPTVPTLAPGEYPEIEIETSIEIPTLPPGDIFEVPTIPEEQVLPTLNPNEDEGIEKPEETDKDNKDVVIPTLDPSNSFVFK